MTMSQGTSLNRTVPLFLLLRMLITSLPEHTQAERTFVQTYLWASNFPDENTQTFPNSSISLCAAYCRTQGDCHMFRLEKEGDGFQGTCSTSSLSHEDRLTAREAAVTDETEFYEGFAEFRNITAGMKT